MLKINDRVRYLGPDTPELGLRRGMEGRVVSINVPDDVFTDDEAGDRGRFYATLATVDFTLEPQPGVMMSLHKLQNAALDRDPAFGDVPQSDGIGVYVRQLERLLK